MRRAHRREQAAGHEDAFASGLLNYTPDDAEELRRSLAGSITTPFDPSYNQDRLAFMHTYQSYPQIIVHCTTVTDVQAALAFARKHKLKVTTRSGGHSTAGYSVNDQMTIDMSAVNHVMIDAHGDIARVGAGTPFRKLNQALEAAGRHVPGGGCETVCVAGYMQGGGYGFTSRLYGMNCDNVQAVTLVLANGTVVRADSDVKPDLYWAVRGGTGNQFGVLVEIEYHLHKGDRFLGFGLRWPLGTTAENRRAAEVLAAYQAGFTSSSDAPAELGHQTTLVYVPTAAGGTGQTPQLQIRGVSTLGKAATRKALAPLIDLMEDPESQIEIWKEGHYMHLNEILLTSVDPPGLDLPTVSPNTQALADCRIVSGMHDRKRWGEVIALFLDAPVRTTFINLEAYGGEINRRHPTDCAFVHRRESLNLSAWTFWTVAEQEAEAREWLARFAKLGDSMGNGRRRRYANYPLRGTRDFGRATFGENLERLMQIKDRVDPEGLFDFEQSLARAVVD
jgi:FAD/FMN-containing dehydrogenase